MSNHKNFNKEISEYIPFIRKVCFGFANNEDELNDLTQEVLIQVWRKMGTFKGQSKLSTWIYRVTVNVCLYEISKKKKNEKIKKSLINTTDTNRLDAPEIESNENQINNLYKAIKKLPELDRAIIMLYLEKKSQKEITEIIGLSTTNIGVRINRIKKKLKKLMSNERD